MSFDLDYLPLPSGLRLRYGISTPADAIGHVFVLQGRAEFIERYDETARDLAQRGLGCVTFDFRGQGGSDRETAHHHMGYVRDIAHYLIDARAVLAHVENHHHIHPDMLMTHSTGGLVGIALLLDDPHHFSSALMISPFFGLGGPKWFARLAHVASRTLSGIGLDKRYLPGQKLLSPLQPFHPENVLTSDQTRYERSVRALRNQPDLIIGGVSAGWLAACFRAQTRLGGQLRPVKQARHNVTFPPVTVVLAGNDKVVDNQATRALLGNLPMVDIREVPGARHEIHHERDALRDRFWHFFDQHLKKHPLRKNASVPTPHAAEPAQNLSGK